MTSFSPATDTAPSSEQPQVADMSAAAAPAIATAFFGLFILWGAGFAQPEALHNATHDTRHAFAFPCH